MTAPTFADRYLRFPNRATAVAFAAAAPFNLKLDDAQEVAGGIGWALVVVGSHGKMRSRGVVDRYEVGEEGEPVPVWSEPPAELPGYHVNFTIDLALPTAATVLAAIDASGFALEVADPEARWAR